MEQPLGAGTHDPAPPSGPSQISPTSQSTVSKHRVVHVDFPAEVPHQLLSQSSDEVQGVPCAPGVGGLKVQRCPAQIIGAGQSAFVVHAAVQYLIFGTSVAAMHIPLAQLVS